MLGDFVMMRFHHRDKTLLALILALFVSFTPATLGALWPVHAAHDQCCQSDCDSPQVPAHPVAPESCCSIGNPDQGQAVQITQSSVVKDTPDASVTNCGLPSTLYLNPCPQSISALEALRQDFRARSDYSALLCTFLI